MLARSVCLKDLKTMMNNDAFTTKGYCFLGKVFFYIWFCRKHKIRLELFYVAKKTKSKTRKNVQHYLAYIKNKETY